MCVVVVVVVVVVGGRVEVVGCVTTALFVNAVVEFVVAVVVVEFVAVVVVVVVVGVEVIDDFAAVVEIVDELEGDAVVGVFVVAVVAVVVVCDALVSTSVGTTPDTVNAATRVPSLTPMCCGFLPVSLSSTLMIFPICIELAASRARELASRSATMSRGGGGNAVALAAPHCAQHQPLDRPAKRRRSPSG